MSDHRPPFGPPSALPPLADVLLGVSASRVSPNHHNALNGHHGIALNQAQAVLVRRCDSCTQPGPHMLAGSECLSVLPCCTLHSVRLGDSVKLT